MSIISDHVGKRVLMTVKEQAYSSPRIEEWKILEVSPSGNYVRIMSCFGAKHWHPVIACTIVEALMQPEPNPAKVSR